MNETPKVSVIVATYNHENYIAQTLESIVKQQCGFAFEAIVGDDASKDGTAKIVDEYAKNYPDIIKPVLRKKNLGAFRNTKDLYDRAQGEYIALLEGDDYWLTDDKLAKQVEFMESHPGYVAHFGRCIVIDRNGERNIDAEGYFPTFSEGDYTVAEFNDYLLPGQTATALYRRKTLEDLMRLLKTDRKVRPRLPVIDRFLVMGVLHFGRIRTDGERLAAYRFVTDSGSGSWSSKNNAYTLRNIFLFLLGLHEFERIGRLLGLGVDFDKRRRYEYRKLSREKGSIPRAMIIPIKLLILLWYRDKKELFPIFCKKVRKRIRRIFSQK